MWSAPLLCEPWEHQRVQVGRRFGGFCEKCEFQTCLGMKPIKWKQDISQISCGHVSLKEVLHDW